MAAAKDGMAATAPLLSDPAPGEQGVAAHSPGLATVRRMCPAKRRSGSPSDTCESPPRGTGLAGCESARHGRQSRRRHAQRLGRAVKIPRPQPITRPPGRAYGIRTGERGDAHGLLLPHGDDPLSSDPPSQGRGQYWARDAPVAAHRRRRTARFAGRGWCASFPFRTWRSYGFPGSAPVGRR